MTTTTPAIGATPFPPLLAWLLKHDIEHEVHEHHPTERAVATARAEGIDPRRFAKTVVLMADGHPKLVVVDAPDRVDLAKAAAIFGADHVRLATEDEILHLAPGCEVGTMPPVGLLFGVGVTADRALLENPEIWFHAGSHRYAVNVDRAAWSRSAHVTYASLSDDDTPTASDA